MSDQQYTETPEQAEAFECYVRMPRRSLRALAVKLDRARSTVESWSKDGNWAERVRDRDAVAGRVAEEQWLKEVAKRRKQKRVAGETLLAAALKGLQQQSPSELKPADIARYVKLADELLDQVVDGSEPNDPRQVEALVRDFAEEHGIDPEEAVADGAAFDERHD